MKEREGICFRCNEKYGLSHRCKKLFLIQAIQDDDDNCDVEMQIDAGTGEQSEEVPEISLHAMLKALSRNNVSYWQIGT